MIQLSFTPKQLQILKEALDYHLEGFSQEDAPQDWSEASDLNKLIAGKLNEHNTRAEATFREMRKQLGV